MRASEPSVLRMLVWPNDSQFSTSSPEAAAAAAAAAARPAPAAQGKQAQFSQ
jgi:hypothetical protein